MDGSTVALFIHRGHGFAQNRVAFFGQGENDYFWWRSAELRQEVRSLGGKKKNVRLYRSIVSEHRSKRHFG